MKVSCFLSMLAIFYHFRLVSTFQCSDLSKQSQCEQLTGCTWNTNACQGTFSSTCSSSPCYYIDSGSTSSTADGTAQYPLKSLTDGFTKLGTSAGTLIVINYQDKTTIQVTKTVTLSSVITIKPLFPEGRYYIDFSKVTPAASITSFITTTKSLSLIGAILADFPLNYNRYRLFSITVGLLTFQNVTISNFCGPTSSSNLWYIVYDSSSSASKYASFTFDTGIIQDSTARFQVNGVSLFKNLQISNYSVPNFQKSNYAATIQLQNCHFTTFSGILLSTGTASKITIQDSSFQNSNIMVFSLIAAANVLISNTTFQDLLSYSDLYPIISAVNLDPSYTYIIQDCIFKNISVTTSVLYFKRSLATISLIGLSFQDITKLSISTNTILQSLGADLLGLCVNDQGSTLSIISSNFTDISSHCIGLYGSNLFMNDSIFDNSQLQISSETSLQGTVPTSLTEKSGISWIIYEATKAIKTGETLITLENNQFIENKDPPLYGGVFRFIDVMTTQIKASGNQFTNNKAYYGGAIYGNGIFFSLSLSSNTFKGNSALYGGAIWKNSSESLLKSHTPSVIISGDIFQQNTATEEGGALYLNWESLALSDANFIQNQAKIGGAIYFSQLDNYYNKKSGSISNTLFKNNVATQYGAAMKLYFDYSSLNEDSTQPCIFKNNVDPLDAYIHTSRPNYFILSVYDVITLEDYNGQGSLDDWMKVSNHVNLSFAINTQDTTTASENQISQKSGKTMSQIIVVKAMDNYNNVADYLNDINVMAQMTSYTTNINNNEPLMIPKIAKATLTNGKAIFRNAFRLTGDVGTTVTLNFYTDKTTTSILNDASVALDLNIGVKFVDCSVGEFYNRKSQECDPCQSGSYSLADPHSGGRCSACPDGAKCYGGAKIAPNAGFWRFSNMTAAIYECRESSSCLGGDYQSTYYPQGLCADNYEGNLCGTCSTKFARFGSDSKCSDCQNGAGNYLKSLLYFFINILQILYLYHATLAQPDYKKTDSIQKQPRLFRNLPFNLSKIIVSHIQLCSLILQYRFRWPSFASEFFQITNKFAPFGNDAFSIDCLLALNLQDNSYIEMIKLPFIFLEPLLIWAFIISLQQLYFFVKTKSFQWNTQIKEKAYLLFVITAFFIQPHILNTFLKTFRCQNYTRGEASNWYLVDSPEIQCYTKSYYFLVFLGALPFILLSGILLPITLLRRFKKSIHKRTHPFEISFLKGDLKNKLYWWEFFVLVRKSLIIVTFCTLNFLSIQVQSFFALGILITSIVLLSLQNPHLDSRLNHLESLSLLTIVCMIFPGLFSIGGEVGTDYQNIHKSQAILSVIFCATFYFLAVFYLALELRKSKVDTTSILREQAEDLNIQSVQEDRNNQTQSRHEMNDFNVLSTERLRIDDSEPFDILSQENIQMSSRRGLITPRETPEKHRRTFSPLNLDDLAGLRSPTNELANPFAESPSGQQVIRRFPEPARFNTLNATDSSFQSRSMSTLNLRTQKMNSKGQESSIIKGDQYDLPNPPKSLLDLE